MVRSHTSATLFLIVIFGTPRKLHVLTVDYACFAFLDFRFFNAFFYFDFDVGVAMRGSVFAFEAFLMAGGWLVFGEAQKLWIGGSVGPLSRVAQRHSAAGAQRPPKLVLGTLKNTDIEHSRSCVLKKARFSEVQFFFEGFYMSTKQELQQEYSEIQDEMKDVIDSCIRRNLYNRLCDIEREIEYFYGQFLTFDDVDDASIVDD